jgi:hypothetical protein
LGYLFFAENFQLSSYIDKEGKNIFNQKFSYAGDFHEGLAHVKRHYKSFYIDKNGQDVFKQTFDKEEDFDGESARVKIDGKYFYIDKNGHPQP